MPVAFRHVAQAARTLGVVTLLTASSVPVFAVPAWRDRDLSPDRRAQAAVAALTLDEKIGLLHGIWATPVKGVRPPAAAVGGAGYVPGVDRIGLPALQETDAGLGIANPDNYRSGDQATPLPSGLAMAASFDLPLAREAGEMIGDEAARKGFNVLLGGGADLIRDPRGGRSFEYASEDPLLTGSITGAQIAGVQSNNVISTLKHFAVNDQESDVFHVNSRIAPAAMRESDLLAFEIAFERGHPAAVMCAYNRVNDVPACQNGGLLTDVLRRDWHFPGFVMSDWGAVHATEASIQAGLDQESGEQFDHTVYYGDALKNAVLRGSVPMALVDGAVRRIVRSEIALGLLDTPSRRGQPIDIAAHAAIAQRVEEAGIVLLRNQHHLLPLSPALQRIVLIGGHADQGVLSGGGSPQVIPYGGAIIAADGPTSFPGPVIYDPSSPLLEIRRMAPHAIVTYVDGKDVEVAARAARAADVAILFAPQWMVEGQDGHGLALPQGQDALIDAVATANPRSIVVLQTGDPVAMPWLGKTSGVLEAWYPGSAGGAAIARILFGRVNPSGRLPVTFPGDVAQLPRPVIPGQDHGPSTSLSDIRAAASFTVDYDIEGADVGYRWFERMQRAPLFWFGQGLSYTHFSLSNLHVDGSAAVLRIGFDVRNDGPRSGIDTPQLYVTPPGSRARRLAGWQRVALAPGQTKHLVITAEPRTFAQFDTGENHWRIAPGQYRVVLAEDSSPASGRLQALARIGESTLPP